MRALTHGERDLLDSARRAVLATIDPGGRPRLVPVCFVWFDDAAGGAGPVLYSPLDAKPKRVADPRRLTRVRDILARPEVTVLVDRWDEDWLRLGWLRLGGQARLIEPDAEETRADRDLAIEALLAKYPQYADHDLGSRPLIEVTIAEASSWGNLDGQADRRSAR